MKELFEKTLELVLLEVWRQRSIDENILNVLAVLHFCVHTVIMASYIHLLLIRTGFIPLYSRNCLLFLSPKGVKKAVFLVPVLASALHILSQHESGTPGV